MNDERFGKLGEGLLALVLSFVLVLGTLGFVTIFGAIAYRCIYIVAAGLIVALVARFLQFKLRLVVFHGLAGVIGGALTVIIALFLPISHAWTVAVCLAIGIVVAGVLMPLNLGGLRALVRPESPREHYLDDVGERHFFVVRGYTGPAESKRGLPLIITVALIPLSVLVLLLLLWLTWSQRIDGATWWASLGAFVAALELVQAYPAFKVERESGVQLFTQCLPDQGQADIGSKLALLLPKPAVWLGELLRDIGAALRELFSVSVRT